MNVVGNQACCRSLCVLSCPGAARPLLHLFVVVALTYILLCCRDFTVPYTPAAGAAAATAAAGAAAADHYTAVSAAASAAADPYQAAAAVSGSNVLQCDLEQVAYTPTIDALHTIFATYGYVQKLTISEKNHHWQVNGQ